MKIRNVSRKSLPAYLAVFLIMLLFEAPRLNPLLEREGAKYPFLLEAKEILEQIGEKSGIYGLSRRLHDGFSHTVSLFGEPVNAAPHIAAYMDTWRENAVRGAQNGSADKTAAATANAAKTDGKTGEALPQTDLNSQDSGQNSGQDSGQNSGQNSENPTSSVRETGQAEQTGVQNAAQSYTYSAKNYPFSEKLVQQAENPGGIACYNALLPDYGKKKTVLLIGDSMMMEGLGPTLHHRLRRRDNLDVYREGKYSSGLSRPDFYDWPSNLTAMLEKYRPDLLIMSLGANDTQDIVIDKKRYFIDTKPWAELYLQRSKEFIALADDGRRHIVWVSLPVMGKEPYFTRTRLISQLQEEASKTAANAEFVNIEHLLTENGKYTTFYKDKNNQSIRLRSQDLIHVSTAGGEILTDYVLPTVDKHLSALYAEDVPLSYPPAAGMASRVTFTSKLRQKLTEYYIWLPQTDTVLKEKPRAPLAVQETIAAQLGGKKFPVLYLLHGATGSGKDFAEQMGQKLQKLADSRKVIIVAPSCEPFGWYLDSPLIPDSQIAAYITEELVPHIDSLYPVNGRRAIAGLSMGGHGALLIGFKNKSLFQSMASISGVLDIRSHVQNWNIKKLLGEYAQYPERWEENAVQGMIAQKWPATSPRSIIVLTGAQDTLVLEENRKAKELFYKRGFKIDYAEKPGGHTWEFWNEYIPQVLEKQADYLNSVK